MHIFAVSDLVKRLEQQDSPYLEFLRVPSLSVGLYTVPAGAVDPQEPHTEDEVYYVVSGRASILVDKESQAVEAGSIIFVAAHVEHRFHSISEDLTVLVLFAPAEYSQAPDRLEMQA